ADPPMVEGSCAQLGGGTTTRFPVTPAPREIQPMSHLARGGFAAMFAALALLVAAPCAAVTPCRFNGVRCRTNQDCCSGVCTANVCGPPTTTTCQAFPATGQTTCWNSSGTVIPCAGTGHDGDTLTGAPLAYVDNGDGT